MTDLEKYCEKLDDYDTGSSSDLYKGLAAMAERAQNASESDQLSQEVVELAETTLSSLLKSMSCLAFEEVREVKRQISVNKGEEYENM